MRTIAISTTRSHKPHSRSDKRVGHVSPARSVKPCILMIDTKKLRQAGIMRLFEAWADAVQLGMTAVEPEMPLEKCSIDASCKMVILSVGSASVADAQQETWIRSVRTLLPEAS